MASTSPGGSLPAGTRIGRTAFRVADLDEMTAFYHRVVGLEILDETETMVSLGVDGDAILVLETGGNATARSGTATGLYHNAFRVPSRSALGDALGRIRADWHLDGATDHRVSEALYLTDPEGHGVEIYRDRPREEWPITEAGHVDMGNYPLDLQGVKAAATGTSTAPSGTDLGHVHLEVASIDDFESFYVETLGFEVRASVPSASFVAAGGYHHHLAGNTWHGRTDSVAGFGLAWFEIVLPNVEVLESLRSRLSKHGVSVTETDEGLVISDPDENEIRLRTDT